MRETEAAKTKFWALTVVALLVGAAGLAALVPVARAAAISQSAALTASAATANGGEAEADYRLAVWLNPHNHTAYLGLAQIQIAAGQADLAVETLKSAGQGSDAPRLRVRTLIELERASEAANAAAALTGPSAPQADLTLAGLTYALAGRTSDSTALIPRLTSPEAAQTISRANAGKLTLAAELYATGLLNSSSALLSGQAPSFERNLLLSRILYTRHTGPDLNQAAGLLNTAVTINPTSLEARRLLQSVYADQDNTSAAGQQAALIAKLQSGRP